MKQGSTGWERHRHVDWPTTVSRPLITMAVMAKPHSIRKGREVIACLISSDYRPNGGFLAADVGKSPMHCSIEYAIRFESGWERAAVFGTVVHKGRVPNGNRDKLETKFPGIAA